MDFLTFVLKNWRLVAVVAAVVASFFAGAERTQMKWNLDIAFRMQSAQAKAIENANKIALLEVTKHENLDIINNLKRDVAAARVRVPKATASASCATSVSDGVATTGLVPAEPQDEFDRFRSGLESDAFKADKVIEDCRVLRDWAAQFPLAGAE